MAIVTGRLGKIIIFMQSFVFYLSLFQVSFFFLLFAFVRMERRSVQGLLKCTLARLSNSRLLAPNIFNLRRCIKIHRQHILCITSEYLWLPCHKYISAEATWAFKMSFLESQRKEKKTCLRYFSMTDVSVPTGI